MFTERERETEGSLVPHTLCKQAREREIQRQRERERERHTHTQRERDVFQP